MSANHERKYTLSILVLMFSSILAALASFPASAQTQVITINPDRAIMRAQHALRQGDLEVALKYYKQAERKNLSREHRTVVLNSICAVSYLQGNYDDAAEACSSVIDETPGYWKAYVTRGNAKRALGDFDGALVDFCEANRLSPDTVSGKFVSRCTS